MMQRLYDWYNCNTRQYIQPDLTTCWPFIFRTGIKFKPSKTSIQSITLCSKSPSVRGFDAFLPVCLLFKSIKHNAFYPVSSTKFICRVATKTKAGEMHCVLWIKTLGEQVKMCRNIAHWGSWTQCIRSVDFVVRIWWFFYIPLTHSMHNARSAHVLVKTL